LFVLGEVCLAEAHELLIHLLRLLPLLLDLDLHVLQHRHDAADGVLRHFLLRFGFGRRSEAEQYRQHAHCRFVSRVRSEKKTRGLSTDSWSVDQVRRNNSA
jgi:hypothetical protein